MKTFAASASLLLWVCLSAQPLLAREIITVAATRDVIISYRAFMAESLPGKHPKFNVPGATRMVVGLELMRMALELGGMPDFEFHFLEVPNSERERAEVKSGFAVLGSQDYWESDFDGSVYMSAPVVHDGQFEKGLYTAPSNAAMLSVKDLDGLRHRIAVMIPTWKRDLATLHDLHPRDILKVYELEPMVRFLSISRADFTLLEFSSSPDLSITLFGVTLVPVPGIKVIIPGNRCFMVSRKSQLGARVYEALSKGLAVLEEEGTIKRAFTECGFFQQRVNGWRIINR